jgi:hypothetical protein
MHCTNCECEISDDEARWGFDEAYCETCFEDMFNYCCSCDTLLRSHSVLYNSDGNPYCDECFEDDVDEDCPDNPDVSDSDRELVVKLSRRWLQGKLETRRPIYINEKDHLLRAIRDKVGLVYNPVYIFGLQDRDEYQISVSADMFSSVQEFVLLNNIEAIVVSTPGCKRIGFSLSLRKQHQPEIIQLIKSITEVREEVLS